MKIAFIDSYYSRFLTHFYREHPENASLSYDKHLRLLLDQFFGTSDYYSYNLQKQGFEARDYIVNDTILQRKWAVENGLKVSRAGISKKMISLPYFYRFWGRPLWMQQIILAQIRKYAPDIVYCQDMSILEPETLREIKNYTKLAIAQIASPIPPDKYFKHFDLVITSFPHFVPYFRKMGMRCEYLKLAFESRILKKTGELPRDLPLVFVGSITPYHRQGTRMLEELARSVGLDFWGQFNMPLSPFSPLKKVYRGEAWGLSMYRILSRAKIVINRHIETAGDYANNMRLFEATGMGAMLITDDKKNLSELFRTGSDIEIYSSVKESIEKVKYYLSHDKERELMAKAGKKRTLKDHNYQLRMEELAGILASYL
ncbi:hypothetical protein A3J20_03585 [Candidatus Gottesmanbacteria bacterium RIFCSPLOWO2_02_FULL_42_29]|uniref:Spore protein YkvP/CgeB glycosyl transferase-like domain-containing protein n=1 Tax=Candidatus Gottesmanbacteria bacterium RIFCSPLOWO2_01_FULL_42_22 TaxID=1798391 RepID=A0A1F6BHN8_9BACT|nr:MAG: hypothetical protein UV46_C0016G0010 [Candidatus Gottesmanbacteria bacterium GW2011_GWC2_42_8]OGG09287.1 MAG: hypothetical protein A2781_03035 [Candidatus Gottesmanbacteria bacterium RIFCSPHIGHO2_01_FULL_42_27]OGG22657.1 MAG: hypothetical protein A3E72_02105 [Candidatus Gottesmanbacteria bacterium RIFCSPHIGHO2_12_FULL_43_26]OGG33358.1 MAG: hypothetical protein A3G68_02230 [Candidatus Gottesmanbacteria bacterium RIFCSPLOWO2_12_FULL_42_10]OGG36333.1 MAG: hypothetical protein A2968_06205 [